MSRKVMKLVNPYTGEMVCKVCGSQHFASIKPSCNGHYYRGSWQCINHCKLEDLQEPEQSEEQGEKS
jgi:hypothetical protein